MTATRNEILEICADFPGASARELAERANCSQARIHKVLWENGFINPAKPARKKSVMTEQQIERIVQRFQLKQIEDSLNSEAPPSGGSERRVAALKALLDAGIKPSAKDLPYLGYLDVDAVERRVAELIHPLACTSGLEDDQWEFRRALRAGKFPEWLAEWREDFNHERRRRNYAMHFYWPQRG